MFDIELAKLPPPTPDQSAINWNAHNGQSLCWSTMPVPIAGASSIAVVRKMVLRPPARRIRNDAGMRIVAPDMPGNGGEREQLSLAEREPQVEHLHRDDSPHAPDREAAEQRRHGDREIAVGDLLSDASQNLSSSGRQSAMSRGQPSAVPWCRERGVVVHDLSLTSSAKLCAGARQARFTHQFGLTNLGPVHPDQRDPDHAVEEHEGAASGCR